MINRKKIMMLLFIPLMGVSACTQTTPSMMNSAPMTVSEETIIDQIPYADVNSATISRMADYYLNNSTGPLGLTLTYDPNSTKFTKSKASHEMSHLTQALRKKGVDSTTTNIMPMPNSVAMLIINYDMAVANAPADCGDTPGLYDNQTGRFIGEYKFGCGVETMFAKQISNPTDLYGNSEMGVAGARRAAIVVEGHAAGVRNEPLAGVETNERLGN